MEGGGGLQGKKEAGAPGASGIPQREVGRPRSQEAAWRRMDECLKRRKKTPAAAEGKYHLNYVKLK